jgi:hypothetical protein
MEHESRQLIIQIHLKKQENENGPINENTTFFSGVKSNSVLCSKDTAKAKQPLYRPIRDPEGYGTLRSSDF